MSKYAPLQAHLARSKEAVELSFHEIEQLLGFDLPRSARRHSAWWSNSGGAHVQSFAWLKAGYRTQNIDLVRERVRFVRGRSDGFEEMSQIAFDQKEKTKAPTSEEKSKANPTRHPLFGVWKGLVKLDSDHDYTQPADPDWAKVYED